MILLDMEIPETCFDCRFRTDTGECELTGLYTSHKAYVMPLSYDCPIKAEIPKDATNIDILSLLLPEKAMISADKHGYLHIRGVKKEWLKESWKGQENAD